MKWVTWEHVGVDRIGCAWLIRRWIDPAAEFLFIPRDGEIPQGAEPFDIPGVRFSHHQGHCSFHALVAHHQLEGSFKTGDMHLEDSEPVPVLKQRLRDPVLRRIARMIDEADTVQEASVEPGATGLDLICEGLRLISAD